MVREVCCEGVVQDAAMTTVITPNATTVTQNRAFICFYYTYKKRANIYNCAKLAKFL